MSFKNLEQRFNENVDKLYAGSTSKFDGGRASIGRNDDPLIVRAPGDGYWNRGESRSTPIVSATNDVKRLTLFTLSTRGVLFLSKQQLLQTGNTFESSRLLNPSFHISNAIPFLHTKRSFDVPVTVGGVGRLLLGNNIISRKLFGSGEQKKDVGSLRKIAQLQKETYNNAINRKDLIGGALKKIPVIGKKLSAVTAKRSVGDGIYEYKESRPELSTSREVQAAGRALAAAGGIFGSGLLNTFGQVLSLYDNGYIVTKHRGDKTRFQKGQTTIFDTKYGPSVLSGAYETYLTLTNIKKDWVHGSIKRISPGPKRDNITTGTPFSDIIKTDEKSNLLNRYKESNLFKYSSDLTVEQTIELNNTINTTNKTTWYKQNVNSSITPQTIPYLKYFTADKESITKQDTLSLHARDRALGADGERKKISYIKDPSNKPRKSAQTNVLEPYKLINHKFSDAITVSFAMGKNEHIQFRAYITNLQQNVKPEYKSYQYIGRMERFINYTGVQRQLSFKLGIIAFSRDELTSVWRRINYLTGMAYPYGFNKGILQPNVIRLTIGSLFTDQPGYIDSIDTNFSEIAESWDIKTEIPISAVMDIKFVIIEKATRIASSPFYGITDGDGKNIDGEQTGTTLDKFTQTIPVAEKKETPTDPQNDPPKTTTPDDQSAQFDYPVEYGSSKSPDQPLPQVDPDTGFYIYP